MSRTVFKLNVQEFIGRTINRVTIVSSAPMSNGRTRVLCKCSCGKEFITSLSDIKTERTKSCGCLWIEIKPEKLC